MRSVSAQFSLLEFHPDDATAKGGAVLYQTEALQRRLMALAAAQGAEHLAVGLGLVECGKELAGKAAHCREKLLQEFTDGARRATSQADLDEAIHRAMQAFGQNVSRSTAGLG